MHRTNLESSNARTNSPLPYRGGPKSIDRADLKGRREFIDRPEFLRRGVAGAAALLATTLCESQEALSAAGAPSGAVDAHVHVWTPDIERYPLADGYAQVDMQPASFTPEQLMEHAGQQGVTRIVLIQMSFYGFDNAYMLDVMSGSPGVFSGVAVIDETAQPVVKMNELAGRGVRGFRIRPDKGSPDKWLAGAGMHAMWKCGSEKGLAMCCLIDARFLPSVDAMCVQFPDTPVVIDHFARIGVDGEIREADVANLCRLARHRNVAVKTSAFYALGRKQAPYHDLGPMFRRVLDAFGPERLMWASDCPFQVEGGHTYAASIDLVRRGLDFLSDGDRQWLLGKTAQRVFFSS